MQPEKFTTTRSFLYSYGQHFTHKFFTFPVKHLSAGRQVLVTHNDFTAWLKKRSNQKEPSED